MIWIAVGAAVLLCGTLLYRHLTRIKTAEAEQKTQTVTDTAKLYSFVWHQSAENTDACFMFSFDAAEEAEAAGHYLSCTFRTPDGEAAEYTDVPVTDAQWHELETALHGLTLPPYAPPDPYLMDATDSCVEVCWTEGGNRFTNRYNGAYAHGLHAFLLTLIGQITE